MANLALALVEAALRARKLDRTLTTALPLERVETRAAPTDVASLDRCLRGGLPRGQLSEIAGPQSSGRTTLLLQVIAAATRRGEMAALVDTFDRVDVSSAVSADVELDRLLWIRGHDISRPQGSGLGTQGCLRPQTWPSPEAGGLSPGALFDRTIDRALKALNLVLQAGGFGVVAIDLADAPLGALNRIPFTTWLRIQRVIEGSDTVCVIVGPQPLARSAGGLTISLRACPQWANRPQASGLRAQTEALGPGPGASFLAGLDVAIRVVSPRRRVDGEITIGAQVQGCSGA